LGSALDREERARRRDAGPFFRAAAGLLLLGGASLLVGRAFDTRPAIALNYPWKAPLSIVYHDPAPVRAFEEEAPGRLESAEGAAAASALSPAARAALDERGL